MGNHLCLLLVFFGLFEVFSRFAMIFTVSLVALLVSFTQAATSDDEIPLVVASPPVSDDGKDSSSLELNIPPILSLAQSPSNKGRSDIEIEKDQPSGGYFYPKPSKPFDLPAFKTLNPNAPQPIAFAEETQEVDRQPRSPQRRRRPNSSRSPPPFIPGFIPPNQIRPLPALYRRPMIYY